MLTLSVSQMLLRLRTADRTLLAVAAVALIALLYAGNQGLAWWSNYSQAGDLRQQALQLQTAIANARVDGTSAGITLDQYETQLDEEAANLTYATDDEIVGLLGDLARDSRVQLTSVAIAGAGTRTVGPVTYRVVNISARIEGQLSRIYAYMDLVVETSPSTSIVSVALGGFELTPSASLELELLVDPQPAAGSAS